MIATSEPKNKTERIEKFKLIDKFLSEILEFLTTDSKYVRESVMALTGTSISASAYPALVQYLNSQMKQSFLSMGQVNVTPKSTLFVDQSISLTRHVLELPQVILSNKPIFPQKFIFFFKKKRILIICPF